MPSSSSTGARLRRLVALLGTLVLLPLVVVLGAAPAQADAVAFELTGTVEDAAGGPLLGVTVTAYEAPGDTVEVATDDTLADGSYTLEGLVEGDYHLHFTKDGYRDWWYGDGSDRTTISIDAAGAASDEDDVIEDNVVPTQALTSPMTHDVTGTVTSAGSPIDGITVAAYPNGDDEEPGITATSSVGTGGYTLALETGSYQIRYSHPSFLGTWYGVGNTASDTAADVIVKTDGSVVVEDNPTGCGSTVLCPIAMTVATGSEEHPVAGDVADANGDPIPDIHVKLLQSGTSTVADQGDTDAAGHYSVDVVAGDYNVEFSGTGWTTDKYRTGDSNDVAVVTVAPNGDLSTDPVQTLSHNALSDATLVSTATSYSGSVVVDGGGALNNIQVAAFPDGDASETPITAVTNPSGDYTLALPVGAYEIRFTDPGGSYVQTWLGGNATHTAVKVAQGPGNTRVLTLDGTTQSVFGQAAMSEPEEDQTYQVHGTVSDVNGDGIAGIAVTATGTTPVTSAGDGTYTIELEEGTYTVSAHDPAGHFTDGALRNEDDTASASVHITSTGTITVDGAASTGELDDIVLNGTQTFGLNGTVTNGTTGLVGIDIDVFAFGDETLSLTPTRKSTSGGSWTTGAILKIGTYAVRFRDNVADGTTYSTTWLPSGGTAKEVRVAQDGKIYVDDVLRTNPLAAVVMPTVTASTTYPVIGEVDDVVDEPLASIHVNATVVGSGQADADVTTSTGLFHLDLKPGTYNVTYSGSKAGGAADNYTTATYRNDDDELATIQVSSTGDVTVVGNEEPGVPGGELSTVNLVGPAKHGLTGTVVGSPGAAPLAGITVEAILDGDIATIASTTTNASGAFNLQVPVGYYKIRFTDNVADGANYQLTWFVNSSAVVTSRTNGTFAYNDAALPNLGTVSMPAVTSNTRYNLAGSVYEPVEFEALDGVAVTAVPVAGTSGSSGGSATTGADPDTENSLGDAGVYRIAVLPGKYQLKFVKAGYETAYLKNYDDLINPVTITVSATGTISAPGLDLAAQGYIDDMTMLRPKAAFKTLPKLSGKVAVGQVVSTTFGTLQGASIDKDYVTIEWFLDGKNADDYSIGNYYEKFKVPAVAATKKLSYRIVIDDPDGVHASTVFTSKPVAVPKAPAKVKGVLKKGKLTVTLAVPGLPKPTGVIVVKDGKKKVATIKLTAKSKGKAVLPLSKLKLKAGKHTLTLSYAGSKTINKATAKVKVTVKK